MGDRSDLLFNLDTIVAFAQKTQKEAASGQTDLFGMLSDGGESVQSTMQLQPSPTKHTNKERLTWERELLGLYISAHPLDGYATYLSEQAQPLTQLVPEYDSRVMTIGGLVTTVRTIITKSGSKMAFVGIEDKFGEGELLLFFESATVIDFVFRRHPAIYAFCDQADCDEDKDAQPDHDVQVLPLK